MPGGEPRPQAKDVIRHRLAMEIVHEPTRSRSPLRPLKELHDLRIGKVMGQEGADHDVDISVRGVRKCVADDPFNLLHRRSRFSGGANGVRVHIDAGQRNRNSAPRRPCVDSPQHIAIATAHIHHAQRLR